MTQLLTATLAKTPRQVNTKHGARTVADIQLDDGTEQTLWRPANDPTLTGLREGATIQLTRDSKGKLSLIENAPQATTAAPGHESPASAREAYLSALERVSNRYQACITKAKQVWSADYSEDELKALPELLHSTAASLFIEANKMIR